MALQILDTLTYEVANRSRQVRYDDAVLPITVTFADSPLDGGLPMKVVGAEVPTRTYSPGVTIISQYCDDLNGRPQTGVTVVAIAAAPYARIDEDPAATLCALPAPGTCDLVATYTHNPGNNTITLSVTTTHGPWRARQNGQGVFEVGKLNWPVTPGSTGFVQVFDASNCEVVVNYTIPGTPGGTDPDIDSFQLLDGSYWFVVYNAGPPRTITATNADHPTGSPVSVSERGRAADSIIKTFCEGTTQVVVRAKLNYPYAYLSVTENSAACGYSAPGALTLTANATAPAAPGEKGTLTATGGGGTAPLFLEVLEANEAAPIAAGQPRTFSLLPDLYTVRISDASNPAQIVTKMVRVPAYTVAPAGPPGLPEPPWQNLETFPFAAAEQPLPDALDPACADAPYRLTVPTTGFLPFCLRRLPNPARWLDCARILDAETLDVLFTFDPRALSYAKFTDSGHDYFLYYGSAVEGLALPTCRALRLQIDEFTSAAFVATPDLSGHLLARWYHDGPLFHLPYGTGLQQWLYVAGATLREEAPREERTETKNAVTGRTRLDFLAQARTVSFDVEPLPAWLVQAVQGAKKHRFFQAGSFQQGGYPVKDVKQTAFGALSCARSLSLTLEYPPDVVVGCAEAAPALSPLPAGYAASC
jgi:hypothetical protein